MTCTTILTVEPVHTGPTAGICGGAVLAAPGVADNGGPHECPPQPFWTGVAMAPCFTSFPTRWTYSPHRFMQVPTNADFRSLSDSHVFGTVLHERTLKTDQYSNVTLLLSTVQLFFCTTLLLASTSITQVPSRNRYRSCPVSTDGATC